MCGIAGYSTIGSDRRIDPKHLTPMLSSLDHRGPDDSGTALFPQLALGSTRLSIVDVEGGAQPIENEDGSVVVVYNGELYNAPELRESLLSKGHIFATSTDTEVLVHLYEEEGINFLERLNGMFAFALYDKRAGRLIVARDRFGVKPLFWSYRDGMLAFASELKALKILPQFDASLDPEGISVFLGLFYIPNPWTIYKHVKKLRPGHFMILSASGLREECYWDIDYSSKDAISIEDAGERTAELLRQSIRRQLISDVPVGVLLSGGLDSRSVLAGVSEQIPNPTAFTITFAEQLYDEGGQAALCAKMFGATHRPMLFTENDFCDGLVERQQHLDEPYGLWCNVATGAFANFIHENGYKVVLTGEGGDELFLGYPTVHAAYFARYYHWLPNSVREHVIKGLVRRLPAGSSRLPMSFMLKSFVEADCDDLFRMFFRFKEVIRYSTWPQLLTPSALELVGDIDPYIAFDQYRSKLDSWNFIDALSYLDFKVFLEGCSFVGNDNAYMSASVESRVPFMDNDLVDFAARLPVDVRFHPFQLKRVLNRALGKYFPPPNESVSNGKRRRRVRKSGFEVPANLWMHNPGFQGLLKDILSEERLKEAGFFRPDAVAKILADQLAGRQNNERVLQAIMSLSLFLQGSDHFN